MRYLLIFSILIFFTSCKAQTDKNLLENWKSYQVPTNQDTLNKLGFSSIDWTVFSENNKVHVVNSRNYENKSKLPFNIKVKTSDHLSLRGNQSVIKVDDGYLVGFYRGEWGGDLYWFSNDGKQYYKISGDEIVQFIHRNNTIYAIQGIDHLGMSEGSILSIEKDNNKWISKAYLKLPTAPEAVSLDMNNNFIVVTSKSLLQIDTNAVTKVLIEKGIWYYGLYPASLVIENNKVFIGMRKGVFAYDLKSGKQEWLLEE